MKLVKISVFIVFCSFVCMGKYFLYGADDQKNGCGPSKGYELKDDKSEPITANSAVSSGSSNSSNNSSTKRK